MDYRDEEIPMYVATMDAIVNRWFTTYESARASLDRKVGISSPTGLITSLRCGREYGNWASTPTIPTGRASVGTGSNPRTLKRGIDSGRSVSWQRSKAAE